MDDRETVKMPKSVFPRGGILYCTSTLGSVKRLSRLERDHDHQSYLILLPCALTAVMQDQKQKITLIRKSKFRRLCSIFYSMKVEMKIN